MMNSNESVTVIVPVFNRPVLVKRCLDSLKAQTWRPLNVIVVDNASTDNTLDIVNQWKDMNEDDSFKVVVLKELRRGAAYARQTGLEHTASDVVFFFDSDDTMRRDCVASVMGKWLMDFDADVIAWPVARHRDDGIQTTHSITGILLEQHLIHAIFQTQGFAIKTDYLKAVGGWRGEFQCWNDFETGVRILLKDPKVRTIDRPLVDVYPQIDSITGVSFSNKNGLWEKSLDGIKKSIENSGRSDISRLLNIVSYRRAILAADYAKEGRYDIAKPLYMQALGEVPMSKRPLIRFAYHWTRMHLRGAFRIVGPFL